MEKDFKKLLFLGIALLSIMVFAPLGYILIEGWPLLDAIYMTIITLATIGYGEIYTLKPIGRIYTILLILMTFGIVTYGVPKLTTYLVEGSIKDLFRRRKMQKEIDKKMDHYLVCGAGRTGRYAIEKIHQQRKEFVVVEQDEESIKKLQQDNYYYIPGDATSDAILKKAGIERAKGLIAALGTDSDNIVLVVTARGLNSKLRIVAQAFEKEAETKLRRAGADEIILSRAITGEKLAEKVLES